MHISTNLTPRYLFLGYKAKVVCVCILLLLLQGGPSSLSQTSGANGPPQPLIFPGALKQEALRAGNPLATYAAMLELESQYRQSKIFSSIYPEVRLNFEEFLGFPIAGEQAMKIIIRGKPSTGETPLARSYTPQSALKVIAREAAKTRLVIWGEEHHLPQTRSLYEALLKALWLQGYRYLAAETFDESVMRPAFKVPDYDSGYYTRDPVFANAVRVATDLGYKLIAYDTTERGPAGDASFRDRTQAENINARSFAKDPNAKVFVIAGRGHASEQTAADGWTPMASVLKRLTGIDPLTLYAPAMSQRSTREEEDPLYRYATSHGLIKQPTIFVKRKSGGLLGSESFDAYIFWPRVELRNGRPDWMTTTLKRTPVTIPREKLIGRGMRLVQAFSPEQRPATIPVDQIVITEQSTKVVLMLPRGRFSARIIDPDNNIIATWSLRVKP